jgi:F-type H+-transporting ATPase subunit alpha
MIEFKSGLRAIVLNLEEDNVGAVLLGKGNDIKEGDTVKKDVAKTAVTKNMGY